MRSLPVSAGSARSFAAERFGVIPDIMTTAKGLTNGAVPMGAVFVRKPIYDAFMTGPEHVVELFHGYTYSAHPLACAAGLAALDVYREDDLFRRTADLEAYWEDAIHSLAGEPHVIDLRNLGLAGAVELEPMAGAPTRRAYDLFIDCFNHGVLTRTTGDIIALTPPLIVEKTQIDQIIEIISRGIAAFGIAVRRRFRPRATFAKTHHGR